MSMSGSIVEARAVQAAGPTTQTWRTVLMRSAWQWMSRITSAWRLRRDLQALRVLDDRMLSDIGLSRGSLEYAARYGQLPKGRRHFDMGHRHS